MKKTPHAWAQQKGHTRTDAELAPRRIVRDGIAAMVPSSIRPKELEHVVAALPVSAGWVAGQEITEEEYDQALADFLEQPLPRASRS